MHSSMFSLAGVTVIAAPWQASGHERRVLTDRVSSPAPLRALLRPLWNHIHQKDPAFCASRAIARHTGRCMRRRSPAATPPPRAAGWKVWREDERVLCTYLCQLLSAATHSASTPHYPSGTQFALAKMGFGQLLLRSHAKLASVCFIGGAGGGFVYTMQHGRTPWASSHGELMPRHTQTSSAGPASPPRGASALICADNERRTRPGDRPPLKLTCQVPAAARGPAPPSTRAASSQAQRGLLASSSPAAGHPTEGEQPMRAYTLRLR